MADGPTPRFLTLADVAEILNTTGAHVNAMVKRGELRGIRIGNRGQWRIENVELERYIESRYAAADEERRANAPDETPATPLR